MKNLTSRTITWVDQLQARLTTLAKRPFTKGLWGPRTVYGFERAWVGLACQLQVQIYGEQSVLNSWRFSDPHPIVWDYEISLPENTSILVKNALWEVLIKEVNSKANFYPESSLQSLEEIINLCTCRKGYVVEDLPDLSEVRECCRSVAALMDGAEGEHLYEAVLHATLQQGLGMLENSGEMKRSLKSTFTSRTPFDLALTRPPAGFWDEWGCRRNYLTSPFLHASSDQLEGLALRLYTAFPRKDVQDWIMVQLGYCPDLGVKGALSEVLMENKGSISPCITQEGKLTST